MGGIQAFKIIGTVSLGILTVAPPHNPHLIVQGTLISTPLITVPALLSLPNAASASRAYDITTVRLQRLSSSLALVAATMYTTTLLLATKKHPYLMYSGVLSVVAGVWGVRGAWKRREVEDGFEYLDAENAEVVKDSIMGLRDWVGVSVSGVGFVVAVIGGYGEGFTD